MSVNHINMFDFLLHMSYKSVKSNYFEKSFFYEMLDFAGENLCNNFNTKTK